MKFLTCPPLTDSSERQGFSASSLEGGPTTQGWSTRGISSGCWSQLGDAPILNYAFPLPLRRAPWEAVSEMELGTQAASWGALLPVRRR